MEEKKNDDDNIHIDFKKALRYTDLIIFTGVLLLLGLLIFSLFQWKASIKIEQNRTECYKTLTRDLMYEYGVLYNDGTPQTWEQLKYQVKKDSLLGNISKIDTNFVERYNGCLQ